MLMLVWFSTRVSMLMVGVASAERRAEPVTWEAPVPRTEAGSYQLGVGAFLSQEKPGSCGDLAWTVGSVLAELCDSQAPQWL